MTWAFLLPLASALAATVLAAGVGGRLSPRATAWVAVTSLASSFVTLLVTAWALAALYVVHHPWAAPFLEWCRQHLGEGHELSARVGGPAVVVAVWSGLRTVRVVRCWRRQRGSGSVGVAIVDGDQALAYAESGAGGGVVVTTAMLAALAPDEQRAMLAHEQSHLLHRHDRFFAVGLLPGRCPLLAPVVAQLRQALERWADEDAAAVVGGRAVVARAVARAALAGHSPPVSALGIGGGDVPARVAALMAPVGDRWQRRWVPVAAVVAMSAVVGSLVQLHHVVELIVAVCGG